jgi:hypothetical protein
MKAEMDPVMIVSLLAGWNSLRAAYFSVRFSDSSVE